MSKYVKRLITDTIVTVMREHVHTIRWIGCYADLQNKLDDLNPGKSRSKSIGYLTYNVPNKPRANLKTTRFLTRKLGLNSIPLNSTASSLDSLIQQAAEEINIALYLTDLSIELVNGKAITEAYKRCKGGPSCMTGNDKAKYTLLYEMNPERFSMLIMTNCNNSARAIIVKLDNGKYYMDRVYSDSIALKEEMHSYAKNKGWYDRTKLGSYSKRGSYSEIFKVSNLVYKNGHIPYMDSFHYGIIENNKLNISAVKNGGAGELYLQAVNGNANDVTECYDCGEDMNTEDAFLVDGHGYCESCFSTSFVVCSNCGEAEYYEDVTLIKDMQEQWCTDCVRRFAVKCTEPRCGDYYPLKGFLPSAKLSSAKEHGSFLDDGNFVCASCITTNYKQCDYCKRYVRYELEEGKCADCVQRLF